MRHTTFWALSAALALTCWIAPQARAATVCVDAFITDDDIARGDASDAIQRAAKASQAGDVVRFACDPTPPFGGRYPIAGGARGDFALHLPHGRTYDGAYTAPDGARARITLRLPDGVDHAKARYIKLIQVRGPHSPQETRVERLRIDMNRARLRNWSLERVKARLNNSNHAAIRVTADTAGGASQRVLVQDVELVNSARGGVEILGNVTVHVRDIHTRAVWHAVSIITVRDQHAPHVLAERITGDADQATLKLEPPSPGGLRDVHGDLRVVLTHTGTDRAPARGIDWTANGATHRDTLTVRHAHLQRIQAAPYASTLTLEDLALGTRRSLHTTPALALSRLGGWTRITRARIDGFVALETLNGSARPHRPSTLLFDHVTFAPSAPVRSAHPDGLPYSDRRFDPEKASGALIVSNTRGDRAAPKRIVLRDVDVRDVASCANLDHLALAYNDAYTLERVSWQCGSRPHQPDRAILLRTGTSPTPHRSSVRRIQDNGESACADVGDTRACGAESSWWGF